MPMLKCGEEDAEGNWFSDPYEISFQTVNGVASWAGGTKEAACVVAGDGGAFADGICTFTYSGYHYALPVPQVCWNEEVPPPKETSATLECSATKPCVFTIQAEKEFATPQELGITGAAMAATFFWAFGAVFMMWGLGYVIGAARTTVNKL